MLACEICGAWVHSRCIGLDDDEDIADKFSDGFCCSVCFMKDEMKDEREPTGTSGLTVGHQDRCPDSPSSSDGSLGDLDTDPTGSFAGEDLWGPT